MTDSEIVKGLEYLTYGGNYCLRCEHKIITGDHRCGIDGCHIAKKALDLINRQKTENSKLQRKNAELQYEKVKLQYENAELQYEKVKPKTEAIKEFSEKLKICLYNTPSLFTQQRYIVKSEVDTLVKEMTEDEGK